MKIDLFRRVALRIDLPEHGLQKDDVATSIEHLPGEDCEDSYALDVFNAVSDTISVPRSAVEPLTADVIPSVRSLAQPG
jgi:hypothetical protein